MLTDTTLCPPQERQSCKLLPVSLLNWNIHGHHNYSAMLRLSTVAGHTIDFLSPIYRHLYGPPVGGRVWEVRSRQQVRHYFIINMLLQ